MSDEFEEQETEKASTDAMGAFAPFLLPAVTAAVALAVGAGIGGLGAYIATKGEPERIEIPRELTAAELEAACAPMVADAMDRLDQAQEKVTTLQSEVDTKQARITELEEEMSKRSGRSQEFVNELESLRAEVKELRRQLEQAIAEKEELVQELKEKVEQLAVAKEELAVAKEELEVAKEDALKNRWRAFVGDAQLEICEKGGRKKMGRCREAVKATLGPDVLDKFRHCVRSGQAEPVVQEADKEQRKEEKPLPEFSSWIDQESKFTKDWYVLLCDPTLPEQNQFKSLDAEWTLEDLDKEDAEKGVSEHEAGEEDLEALMRELDQ